MTFHDLHYVEKPADGSYSNAIAACGATRPVHCTTVVALVTCAGCLRAVAEATTQVRRAR